MSTTIQFSKITKALIFIMAINFNGYTQEISTISEIYDYETGDIFHEVYWFSYGINGYNQKNNIEILNKFYSPSNDTVYYVRDIASYRIDVTGTTITYYIDTIFYSNLNSEINSGNIDSVSSNPDLYNGRLINYYDCYNCDNFDYNEKKWIVGCGGPYEYFYVDNGPNEYYEGGYYLLYYLKGDEEWGEPYYVSIPDISKKNQNIKVFPNPANDFIIIDPGILINDPTRTTIFTTLGNVVQIFDSENSLPVHIDISNLQAGIYFIKIEANNNSLIGRFIKY